ncbi:1-(5-phosphoribosyl)-5-[(5-phosphoribosylamino)methylideneamino] imidazole-4-carboxamide isomerase [Thermovirga sp.]|uniref:1-(5-phosphoribosyl)-5-[(5- phosphoribosylamino)methylideneamino]imidazole-4- carboxamide isomerase n=1 Tax=Thermovirga sp. TaxID=2699834 RepID=UPI0025FD5E19|nr:1-(5-phosphoribosyl)-5-[(5-phosphoribosylamino)methylideneamino] imidazole-4-carboxamide isomerase [Thermovirga sp.]MBO8153761.1 1-(5-phosphoribosyl)-5-[(5-phosphoribosylamino)methylideneamino] imidazole-4-carboxamide isomerase [Thermovirga sp.]
MEIFPALDLFEHKVIRLYKGDFNKGTIYSHNPIKTAENFALQGARWIHVVDLEGAKKGTPTHLDLLEEFAKMELKIQFGGGLRTFKDIENALSAGATRVMVGSLLFRDKSTPNVLFEKFNDRVVPAVDVKNGMVSTHGWEKTKNLHPHEIINYLVSIGYRTFLVTSIDRDGTLRGPEVRLYRTIISGTKSKAEVIAAGGIANISDITKLKLEGLNGVVLGKSIYEGKINIKEALEVAKRC